MNDSTKFNELMLRLEGEVGEISLIMDRYRNEAEEMRRNLEMYRYSWLKADKERNEVVTLMDTAVRYWAGGDVDNLDETLQKMERWLIERSDVYGDSKE